MKGLGKPPRRFFIHPKIQGWFYEFEFHQQETAVGTPHEIRAGVNGKRVDGLHYLIGGIPQILVRIDRRNRCAEFFLDPEVAPFRNFLYCMTELLVEIEQRKLSLGANVFDERLHDMRTVFKRFV
jgi:hypothetical protein